MGFIKPKIHLKNILADLNANTNNPVYNITFRQIDSAFDKITEIANKTGNEELKHICRMFCYLPPKD